MGRKKHRLLRQLKQEACFEKNYETSGEGDRSHQSAKQLSKKQKKHKKEAKKHKVTISKQHPWYLVKVYDSVKPTKEFLQESFRSLVDTDFTILGYHHSTTSARFYLENNNVAAEAIKALDKRMQGSAGRLMLIHVEPCQEFLLLNGQQLSVIKQALQHRFDAASSLLDMTEFHKDPLLLEQNILPVLCDPAIFRQVLSLVRDNIPLLKGISLGKNSLKLSSVRVLAGTLSKCPLQGVNLENNLIDNIKELINVMGVFPLIELKLEGNNCLKDIKDPVLYIKTVRSKLPLLKTLDGVDIISYLASKETPIVDVVEKTAALNVQPEVTVSESLMQKFLEEYFVCLDSEHRLQLVNAYLPNAKFAVQSEVTSVVSGVCEGHDGIREALTVLPATRHSKETFNWKMIKLEPTEGRVEVSGQMQFADRPDPMAFLHTLSIVPYNSGLGCDISCFQYKQIVN